MYFCKKNKMKEIIEKLEVVMDKEFIEFERVRLFLEPCLDKINKTILLDYNKSYEIMNELKRVLPNIEESATYLLDLDMNGYNDEEFGEEKAINDLLSMWCQTYINRLIKN